MLIAQHGKRLPRRRLPIHKDRPIPTLNRKLINNAFTAIRIDFLIAIIRPESMVIDKLIPITSLDGRRRGRPLFLSRDLKRVIYVDVLC